MIDRSEYQRLIDVALAEDLGEVGDLTSLATVPVGMMASATFGAREAGVIAGLDVAAAVFDTIDRNVDFSTHLQDGDAIAGGDGIARAAGPARSILTAERTALNLMARMSGVATVTRRFVDAIAGTGAKISDTRKTMPGMRILDKYAVAAGGGVNHRIGLYDAVMIKDNHLAAGLEMEEAVASARIQVGPDVEITVEVETIDQLRLALTTDADRVLLDNMDLGMLATAVDIVDGGITVEASGGITLENVRAVASTGVDVISIGWITHSAPQLDIGLDFDSE